MVASPLAVVSVLLEHPHSANLCERVAEICLAAARTRTPEVLTSAQVADTPTTSVIAREDAQTSLGNLLEILDRGATTAPEWQLLSAAVALHVARTLDGSAADQHALLDQCTWLATVTACNPWLFLDACLQPSQSRLWDAIDEHFLAQPVAAKLVLAASLTAASSPDAVRVKQRWLYAVENPTLLLVLQAGTPSAPLLGRQIARARGPVWRFFEVVTGYALLRALGRVVFNVLLLGRRDVELVLSPFGMELTRRLRLLGVPIRERRDYIAFNEVRTVRVLRRWQGVGTYVGLAALALGTYFGSSLFWDGMRLPGTSPTLLGWGLVAVTLGVLLDLLFERGLALLGKRKTTQLEVHFGRRRVVAFAGVDTGKADGVIEHLTRLHAVNRSPSPAPVAAAR